VVRCPVCGVHFQGEAQDYLHSSEKLEGGRYPWWIAALAALLLLALVLGAFGLR
jgi:hypothetical protein